MSKKISLTVITLLSFASIWLAIQYNASQSNGLPGGPPGGPPGPPPSGESPGQSSAPATQIAIPDVAVTQVKADSHPASIDAYGEASARYELDLTAEVQGRVVKLSDNFESGHIVDSGEILAQIDQTDYLAALHSAEATLKASELALLEEEREAEQAEVDWKYSGLSGEPDSPLVLRGPQLASAKATVTESLAAVATAQRDLKRTRISSPFPALVVSRDIDPGSYLQAGTTIGTLYSTDRIEISIPLSEQQWRLLPPIIEMVTTHWEAEIDSADGSEQWTAYVRREEKHEDETRQRALILAIDQPLEQQPPLYPGTFLQARVAGKKFPGMWKLPSSALSQNNQIFLVTEENTLQAETVSPLFTDSESIYIRPPEGMDSAKVVSRALMSYLDGMKVNPRIQQDTP